MGTENLDVQNFYADSLKANITASDTVIPLNSVPSVNEGYLVISPDNPVLREIIYYTSVNVGAGTVTCPSAIAGRGQGGTSAKSHTTGEPVKMNIVAGHWRDLKDGRAIASNAIKNRHIENTFFLRASRGSGDISVPGGFVNTVIPMTTVTNDPSNSYNATTGVWTCPKTGFYSVSFSGRVFAPTANTEASVIFASAGTFVQHLSAITNGYDAINKTFSLSNSGHMMITQGHQFVVVAFFGTAGTLRAVARDTYLSVAYIPGT